MRSVSPFASKRRGEMARFATERRGQNQFYEDIQATEGGRWDIPCAVTYRVWRRSWPAYWPCGSAGLRNLAPTGCGGSMIEWNLRSQRNL